jgi:hypothetical protein
LEQTENPTSLSHAIYVVHGIGAHDSGVTAVGLRSGFEDAVQQLREASASPWIEMQPTYIKEGYWGDYGNFSDNFPDLWAQMSKPSRKYFKELWKKRSESYARTAAWYAYQSLRLPWQALSDWQDVRGGFPGLLREIFYRLVVRIPLYLLAVFVSWSALVALVVWPRGRSILSTVMGDVRLYVRPRGPIEQAIRQNIDVKVRDLFLQMIGLGIIEPGVPVEGDFKDLIEARPCEEDTAGRKLLQIGDRKKHKFDRITWVSHSLGTVVSYNVVGDLLCKCKKLREANRQINFVERVEAGLYRFYTMGSPLRKIFWLFPEMKRRWPAEYFERYILQAADKNLTAASPWWVNFRHIWDPVSGSISRSDYFPWAKESHSPEVLTLPGLAHVGYWHTDGIAKYILAQAHPGLPGEKTATLPDRGWLAKLAWHISMIFILGLVSAIIFHIIQLLAVAGLARLAPWWTWLQTVPLLGPILHFMAWLVALVFHALTHLLAVCWHAVARLSTHLWLWLRRLCRA